MMPYDPPKTLTLTNERLALTHRYLYYVLGQTIISDYDYDMLERRCLADPDLAADSPLREPGHDTASSYSNDIKAHAQNLLKWAKANGVKTQ